ncbi:hypothetical protein [Rhizohabitans arisaemae]|uniref:hypothetical protein n=1 Tax=Rhizohabitans arisaemae TaxID=2720610 RepID=UPI0024B04AB5|nr:hypothetical protein [Rhizohabitans arisaemae]
MSDSFATLIANAQGFVHTGSGDLNAFFLGLLKDSKGLTPREVALADLRWLRERFLDPPGFGMARAALQACGCVLLDGARGSGRSAAAKVLLYDLGESGRVFRELLLDDGVTDYLDAWAIQHGERLLLDLSTDQAGDWGKAQGLLPALRNVVEKQAAQLVVALPAVGEREIPPELVQYRFEIKRPADDQVLQQHLRAAGIPYAETSAPASIVARHLGMNQPMRKIARFAELVVAARESAGNTRGFAEWCATARDALTEQIDITGHMRRLTTAPQRGLLLTVAMLHGAHSDVVHQAAGQLLRIHEYAEDKFPLEQDDLEVRLKDVEAELDESGIVRFTKLGYDAAVRSHFWRKVPQLRTDFTEWVGDVIAVPNLDQEDGERLIRRFTELCLHERYLSTLTDLVPKWTGEARNDQRLRAAAQVLKVGLHHEVHGRFFRRELYNWSKDKRIPGALAQLIVEMCTQVIALRHPDQALVRLHHLARRERGTTRARDALAQLIGPNLQFHHRLLARFHHTFSQRTQNLDADTDLFLAISDPVQLSEAGKRDHALSADDVVRDQLTCGWSVVFQRRDHQTWARPAERWLRAALSADEWHRDRLLDVMVTAAVRTTKAPAFLYQTARSLPWVATDGRESHTAFVNRVLEKITAAQCAQVA